MAFRQPDDTFAQVACQANDVGPFPFPWVAFHSFFPQVGLAITFCD